METLRKLLLVMGEELVLESRPLTSDPDRDAVAVTHPEERDDAERVQEVLSWMRLGPLGLSGVDAV